jgi:hypothetical protein
MRIQALLAPLVGLLISFCAQAQDQTLSPGFIVVDGRADCKVFTNVTKDKTIKWSGQCVNGFAEGKGLAEHFIKGVLQLTFDGELLKGKINGQGSATLPNGSKYVGDHKDGKPSGQGMTILANGNKYLGEYKDGKPNGQGTETQANGTKYVGEWKEGYRHGQGIETHHNGSVQEGIWADGKFVRAEKVNLPPVQQQTNVAINEERRKQEPTQTKTIYPINKNEKLPMISVINGCQTHHNFDNFSDWATCIKLSYAQYGTSPNEPAVLNFGAYLDSIDEDYKAGKVSFVKARVQMIEAWRNTIEADNLRNAVPTVTQNVPAQGGGNAWSKAHEIIKGIDPATNQKMVDQMCYSNCIGTGMSMGLCKSKCSY